MGCAITVSASPAHAATSSSVPVFASGTTLLAISCHSAKDCTAVGQNGLLLPIYATETAGVWGPERELSRSSAPGQLVDVSCTSARDCTAVGFDGELGSGSPPFPIRVTESNGTWGPVTKGSDIGGLLGVSCQSPLYCTAVGFGGVGPVYEIETAGTWGAAKEIPGEIGGFNDVSCTTPLYCTAIGEGNNQPIYVTETAGTWGPATLLPAPSNSEFDGLSCTSVTDCTAVGAGGTNEPMYTTEVAGVWSTAKAVASPGTSSGFKSVSCTSATSCTAVGASQLAGEKQQPMHATESAGKWGAVTELSSPLGDGSFYGVSCTPAKGCTAVGSDGHGYALYPSENTGAWPMVPRAPKTGVVTASNRSIEVAWSAPTSDGGAAVTSYTASAISGNRTFTCSTSRRSCTIRGLTNGQSYAVSVIARNPAGSSAESVTKMATPHA